MVLRVVQLAVLIALAGPPAAAAAAADVIHVDPGSPAGKEYGYPLDQAHRDAGSRAGAGSGGSGSSGALFGAGIRPPAGTSSGGSTHRTPHAVASRQAGRPVKASERPPVGAIPSGTAGGAGGHLDIALVACVVLLGGGLGLVLRRRSQRR